MRPGPENEERKYEISVIGGNASSTIHGNFSAIRGWSLGGMAECSRLVAVRTPQVCIASATMRLALDET